MRRFARNQLIGSNFCFQHYPFERVAKAMQDFGMREIELWGVAQHLDLFHASDARVESIRGTLAEHGLSTWCFTPEQVIYPINIASGDGAYRRDSVRGSAARRTYVPNWAPDICS